MSWPWVALLALVALLLARPAAAQVWIEATHPARDLIHDAPVPWTEVQGYTWTGESPLLDVVLAIDLSISTLTASGTDVNGNGRIGRLSFDGKRFFLPHLIAGVPYDPRLLSSDLGDSIAHAELAAARTFVGSMDTRRTRIGLLTFDKRTKVRAIPTAQREDVIAQIDLLIALERRRARNMAGSGTNIGLAMATAGSLLLEAKADDPPRRRQVVLLTDGLPDHPPGHPAKFVAAMALVLADHGIGLHMVPLGEVSLSNAEFFEFIDELAGTSHTKLALSGTVVEALAHVRLDRVSTLEVFNRTNGTRGRGLRLFADGGFDAIVPLADGENLLEFHALATDGSEVRVERRVRYTPAHAGSLDDARRHREAVERFLERLRVRHYETDLMVELERARTRAVEIERELRLEAE